MAMGTSRRERQSELWIAGDSLPRSPGHPFYVMACYCKAPVTPSALDLENAGACISIMAGPLWIGTNTA